MEESRNVGQLSAMINVKVATHAATAGRRFDRKKIQNKSEKNAAPQDTQTIDSYILVTGGLPAINILKTNPNECTANPATKRASATHVTFFCRFGASQMMMLKRYKIHAS